MSATGKLFIVIILFLNAFSSNYSQDKSALRYNDGLNFEVEIDYISGNENDYKELLLFQSGVAHDVTAMLNVAGIPINKKIDTPKLVLKVTADRNLSDKSSGKETTYYITSEIYFIDRVKVIDHPSIRIATVTWRGDQLRNFVRSKNIDAVSNKDIAKLAESFINDYLEMNQD